LIEIRKDVGDLVNENLTLREKVVAVAEAQAQPKVVYERNVAWKTRPDGSREEPPYCAVCHANRQVLMPLVILDPAYYRCSHCKENFCVYPEREERQGVVDDAY
jgi:hypothetical protein